MSAPDTSEPALLAVPRPNAADGGPLPEGKPGDQPQLAFASLPAFVTGYLLPNWQHQLKDRDTYWCATWWEHAEAITRLEALWEAFEAMRLQPPPALSSWLLMHLDPQMATLTSASGPFRRCDATAGIHEVLPSWPSLAPPPGLFATSDPKIR